MNHRQKFVFVILINTRLLTGQTPDHRLETGIRIVSGWSNACLLPDIWQMPDRRMLSVALLTNPKLLSYDISIGYEIANNKCICFANVCLGLENEVDDDAGLISILVTTGWRLFQDSEIVCDGLYPVIISQSHPPWLKVCVSVSTGLP